MSKLNGLKNDFRKGYRKGYQRGYQQGYDDHVKQAVKEFASKIKDKAVDFLYSATVDGHPGFDIHISELCHMIDELLKEY